MATATKPNRRTSRTLVEWSASAPAGAPLVVDRARGVIENVKVLGFKSRNNHGLQEAENGTEYTRECCERAVPLYEGADVLVDHATRRTEARGSADIFGQLRNVRLAEDGIRADLHFLKSHPLAERVCEDVERSLGVYGLSHDASAGRERFDRQNKRLVIESIAAVRSVDLVRKPATNRNLWESHEDTTMPKTTLRELLEALKTTPARRKWRNRLLEDDTLAPSMDAPMDAPAAGDDPDDALWSGFTAAINKLLEKYASGEMDSKAAVKAIGDYLKTHEKLSSSAEPDAPSEVAEEEEDYGSDEKKTESVKAKAELDALKHKLAVRDLVEAAGIKADKALIESLEELPLASARKLVEREKARGGGSPRSSGAPNGGGSGGAVPTGTAFGQSIRE